MYMLLANDIEKDKQKHFYLEKQKKNSDEMQCSFCNTKKKKEIVCNTLAHTHMYTQNHDLLVCKLVDDCASNGA